MEKKISTSVEQICAELPVEFVILLNYVRALRFEEKPDYQFMRKILR